MYLVIRNWPAPGSIGKIDKFLSYMPFFALMVKRNDMLLVLLREYRETLDFDPLRGHEPIEEHQITVCVRKRPLNKKGMQLLLYFRNTD